MSDWLVTRAIMQVMSSGFPPVKKKKKKSHKNYVLKYLNHNHILSGFLSWGSARLLVVPQEIVIKKISIIHLVIFMQGFPKT